MTTEPNSNNNAAPANAGAINKPASIGTLTRYRIFLTRWWPMRGTVDVLAASVEEAQKMAELLTTGTPAAWTIDDEVEMSVDFIEEMEGGNHA